MDVWRICRRRFARRPLSGAGGLHASARWHSTPRLIVYASQSLALASLEMLVHLDLDLPPDDLLALQIALPDNAAQAELKPAQLPRSWRRIQPRRRCRIWATPGSTGVKPPCSGSRLP